MFKCLIAEKSKAGITNEEFTMILKRNLQACPLIIGFFLAALLWSPSALATDRFVDPSGTDASDCSDSASPCATIDYAMGQSSPDDNIYLAAGTYLEDGLMVNMNLTFLGNSRSDTFIDGNNNDRIFFIQAGTTATFDNITFENALNSSSSGGAIECDDCSLIITDCAFTNNRTTGSSFYDGGAIACHVPTAPRTVTIANTIFSKNRSSGDGGAIWTSSPMTITDSTFDDNDADNQGGAIHANDKIDDITIISSTLSNNTALASGGAITIHDDSTVTVINSTFSGNKTAKSGGAIYVIGVGIPGILNLHNVTITDNTANSDDSGTDIGGGLSIVDIASETINIENSIIAGNRLGTAGDECYKGTGSTINSGGYNIIGAASATCDPSLGAAGDSLGVDVATVLNPTTLADNGGPTKTHALIADSPAIDAGTPVVDGGCQDDTGTALTDDQRGFDRPVNGRCDIGAYESGACGDGIVDPSETCDDGNTDDGDGCSSTCQTESPTAICGNGAIEGTEECDDGNTTAGDGCAADCTNEDVVACGDGILQADEECDDGNTTAGDGCSDTCTTEGNGDGNGNGEGGCTLIAGNVSSGVMALGILLVTSATILGLRRRRS
jgi:cysteine-rich repeat protein/predicted outer membrane repeat protein